MISDILEIDSSGIVEFEYQTTENEDREGTWTLIATQNNNKEFTYVGYGELPIIPVNIAFDKLNYKSTEIAIITLAGKPSENVSLIIISPAGNVQGNEAIIQLRADGKGEYTLDLAGYGSGIYTAVGKKGGSQSSETFTVGLQIGSGEISAKLTKIEYQQGERILLLGNTNPNSLLIATLIDPSGNEIKKVQVPSNSEGTFTEERLRIPTNGETGLWKISVGSGFNLDVIEFNVFSTLVDRMNVKVTEEVKIGDLLKISITASHKTSIEIEIIDMNEDIMDDTLTCITTKEFVCETFWPIPKNAIPGTYTIKVNDAISSDEATFIVKIN